MKFFIGHRPYVRTVIILYRIRYSVLLDGTTILRISYSSIKGWIKCVTQNLKNRSEVGNLQDTLKLMYILEDGGVSRERGYDPTMK